jgi:hypothetical protein
VRVAYNSCLMGRSSNGEWGVPIPCFSCELRRFLSP